jgi:glycosyltransferase involved in cell wall biosynthesis
MSVSIIMPAYNTADFIESSVSSILSQSYQNFELLIIDDGSEDDTENIIGKYKDDKRIKYFKKIHTGISDTLNYGLKKANYDLVARLDSDDIAIPYRLEKQIEVLKNNKVDVVSGAYAVFKDNKIQYIIKNPEYNEEIKKTLYIHSCIAHSGVMYKKSVILNSGGYMNTPLEDYELWLRLIDSAVFHNLKEVVTLVRYRKNSESYKNTINNNLIHKSLQDKYLYNKQRLPSCFSQKPILLAEVFREYYYGNFATARKKTRNCFFGGKFSKKLLLLFLLSYLPFRLLESILKAKIVPRIRYNTSFFNLNSRKSRNMLNRSISSIFK